MGKLRRSGGSAAVHLFPPSPPSATGGGALSKRRARCEREHERDAPIIPPPRSRRAAVRLHPHLPRTGTPLHTALALHLLPHGPHAAHYPPHTSSRRAPHRILLAPLARISRQIESGAADADTDAFPSLSPLLPHLLPIPPLPPPLPPQTRCAKGGTRRRLAARWGGMSRGVEGAEGERAAYSGRVGVATFGVTQRRGLHAASRADASTHVGCGGACGA
ncbi:hypothetical protein DFH09DRAFT_1373505 [Mycena vulgaris]|nr:hypothetical protein DFH09DRAFT_1373505 [Mycena vulgaris]